MIPRMGTTSSAGGGARQHRRRGCKRWRRSLLAATLLLGLASCGGGGGDDLETVSTIRPSSTETTDTTALTTTTGAGTSSTTRPRSTTTSPVSTTTTIRVLSTVLVGAVVGGNSGGIGEGDTLALSDTVRTSDSQCIGWTGKDQTPKPWTAALQQGRSVRVLDDKGVQLGTGTLGAGRPKQVNPNADVDKHWQCEFEFSINNVVQASAYHLEIEGVPLAPAEPNPQRAGSFVVAVKTPVDARLISECADGLPDEVTGWDDVVDEYWAVAFRNLCNSGLRIGTVKRQCRPHDVATLYVMSVMARDGTVLQDRASGGPTVDPATLAPGTRVDVTVTTAVPCQ